MSAGDSDTYGFSKSKLPKGWTYPLKRSELDAALEAAGTVDCVFTVRYMLAHGSAQGTDVTAPLYVTYNGESDKSHASGKVDVTLSAVPAGSQSDVAAAITTVLPRVVEWIAATATRSATWRDTTHALYLEVRDGQPHLLEESPRHKKRRG